MRSQEEPRGARRSQEEPEGGRRSQEETGGVTGPTKQSVVHKTQARRMQERSLRPETDEFENAWESVAQCAHNERTLDTFGKGIEKVSKRYRTNMKKVSKKYHAKKCPNSIG